MDYQSIHGQDVSNMSSPTLHRMPTISASQAFQDLQSPAYRCVPTGITELDGILQDRSNILNRTHTGGISRGHVTEVHGAPGSGKTIFGIQVAANALKAGQRVLWIDGGSPLPAPRLADMISNSSPSPSPKADHLDERQDTTALLEQLTHFSTPTLPHLIALICHPQLHFPLPETRVIIIDSLSTLIANAYPRTQDNLSTPGKQSSKSDPAHWAATRKWTVLQYLISSLQKLATLRNIAVVIMTHTVTKMQSGGAAVLIPAITSTAWDAGISTRIVLFRDWGWEDEAIRFAGVLKTMGATVNGRSGVGRVAAFKIAEDGLKEATLPTQLPIPVIRGPMPSRKRKVDEIMDSEDEDEDYGWAEEDVDELPQATQNQGSEDVLAPGIEDEEEEEEMEEGEDDPLGKDKLG